MSNVIDTAGVAAVARGNSQTTGRARAMLMSQYNAAKKMGLFALAVDPANIFACYIKIYVSVGECAGGEYLVRLDMSDNYPFTPPKAYVLTPQGLFDVHQPVCFGVAQKLLKLVDCYEYIRQSLANWRDTAADNVELLVTAAEDVKRMAAASAEYNRANYADVLGLFA
jgi:ubiquitin-protein ligase